MAIVSGHLRLFWGALEVDVFAHDTPAYDPGTDFVTLGPSAVAGAGIGVRRATLRFDRQSAPIADDDVLMHFDFLNFTGGLPDDTWIASDYTALETLLLNWWTSTKVKAPNWLKLSRILWHRVGPGIVAPNPAQRILDISVPSAGSVSSGLPPQVATTIEMRTAMQRHWGRTYFPVGESAESGGRVTVALIDSLVASTVTLANAAKAADFLPVVYCPSIGSALGVEAIAMDDLADIQRRRRWKHRNYRALTAL